MSAVIAYARVSSTDQNLDAQLQQLEAANADRIFQEKISGVKRDRPQLMAALDYVREGDTFIVTKLDRLGRSTADLMRIAEQLKSQGVTLKVLSLGLDTSTANGKLMFDMMASIAEFERSMLRERQAEGIAAAKKRGVYTGRKPTAQAKAAEVLALLDQGITKKAVAEEAGIGVASVYRIIKAAAPKK